MAVLPGQPDRTVASDGDLYARAVVATAKAAAKAGHPDDYNLTIERDEMQTGNIPAADGAFKFSVLDRQALAQRFRRMGRFPVWKVFPAQIREGRLTVGVNFYWFWCRRRFLRRSWNVFELEGGAQVVFRFDCELQSYVVADVKFSSI
jgi:hypothetical protein